VCQYFDVVAQTCKNFHVSAQCSVSGGILFSSCSFVCVCPKTLLTRYLAENLTHFHQTYISGALWDIVECVTIWGQKKLWVKVTVE